MTTRTSRVVDSDNRVPVQSGYDTVNSARFVAALFSRGREAEESERESKRGIEKEERGWSERERTRGRTREVGRW